MPILNWWRTRQEKRKRRKQKTQELEQEYTELIREYEKIQNKTSELHATKRREVEMRVMHLIAMGHIKINKK